MDLWLLGVLVMTAKRVAIAKVAAEKVVADKRTALIARNKVTNAWNAEIKIINDTFRAKTSR
jgi:hypothetical protein